MSKILVSGLANLEMTCGVRSFPVEYQPVDYFSFSQAAHTAGVGFNVTSALCALGDTVCLTSMTGKDAAARMIRENLEGIGAAYRLDDCLGSTPSSVILYDKGGRRRIFCDLKDIQKREFDYSGIELADFDLIVACNVDFSRPLLKLAKEAGVRLATDVHVQYDVHDAYNEDFMSAADVLFLSNEAVQGREEEMIKELRDTYHNEIIVMGCGEYGALMYVRAQDAIIWQEACKPEKIVNTIGAGDALFSAFISLYAKGYEPERCLKLAQTFAAHKIGFNGASVGFMTMEELLR